MPPPPRRESGAQGVERVNGERRSDEALHLPYPTLSPHTRELRRDASALTRQSALLLSIHSPLLRLHHLLRLLGATISARTRSCSYGRGSESGEITPAGARTPTDA
ncbi:hypothetical protein HPB50_004766 [Hyalomma asiaticum]|uniref:Uncharacterized protein n=1 Tax=Hyalomma asiaticum TaxID=266040 RepID=A0ACB7S6L9_HYAAI|nr:hypothetical protein HPB50_004766 [Hyalomma asiaticum]